MIERRDRFPFKQGIFYHQDVKWKTKVIYQPIEKQTSIGKVFSVCTVRVCVCMYACVCVWEREIEREREEKGLSHFSFRQFVPVIWNRHQQRGVLSTPGSNIGGEHNNPTFFLMNLVFSLFSSHSIELTLNCNQNFMFCFS